MDALIITVIITVIGELAALVVARETWRTRAALRAQALRRHPTTPHRPQGRRP
jgi:hypothetical protein